MPPRVFAAVSSDLGRLGIELLDQIAQVVAVARQLRLQLVAIAVDAEVGVVDAVPVVVEFPRLPGHAGLLA